MSVKWTPENNEKLAAAESMARKVVAADAPIWPYVAGLLGAQLPGVTPDACSSQSRLGGLVLRQAAPDSSP